MFLTTLADGRLSMLYTHHAHCSNNRQSTVPVDITCMATTVDVAKYCMSTVDDNRFSRFDTLIVQLCVQRDGRLDVPASRSLSALTDCCISYRNFKFDSLTGLSWQILQRMYICLTNYPERQNSSVVDGRGHICATLEYIVRYMPLACVFVRQKAALPKRLN